MKFFLKSKIHQARVTSKNLEYIGSIFIDKKILELAGIKEFEKVDVVNLKNGNRWQTYVGLEEENSGKITVNGGGSYLCEPGDRLIILNYQLIDELKERPKMILVDESNKFVKYL